MLHYFSNENLYQRNGLSATVSIKNWFALMLISLFSLIPFVGVIISIVTYLCLAFRRETTPSIANFLKAQLILSIIGFVIGIVFIVFISALFANMGSVPISY